MARWICGRVKASNWREKALYPWEWWRWRQTDVWNGMKWNVKIANWNLHRWTVATFGAERRYLAGDMYSICWPPAGSGVVYNFGRVCLSDDNFRKPWRRKFIFVLFVHPLYLQGIRVKCVYEGHRVKVKWRSQERKRSKITIPAM